MSSLIRKSPLHAAGTALVLLVIGVAWLSYERHDVVAVTEELIPGSKTPRWTPHGVGYRMAQTPGVSAREIIREANATEALFRTDVVRHTTVPTFHFHHARRRLYSSFFSIEDKLGRPRTFTSMERLGIMLSNGRSPSRDLMGAELDTPLRAGDTVALVPVGRIHSPHSRIGPPGIP